MSSWPGWASQGCARAVRSQTCWCASIRPRRAPSRCAPLRPMACRYSIRVAIGIRARRSGQRCTGGRETCGPRLAVPPAPHRRAGCREYQPERDRDVGEVIAVGVPHLLRVDADLERLRLGPARGMMSTSMDVQPPIAASSSSVGVKSGPSPVPKAIWPPRSLLTVNRPRPALRTVTARCAESVGIAPPCHTAGPPGQHGGVTPTPTPALLVACTACVPACHVRELITGPVN